MQTVTRTVKVQLGLDTEVDVRLAAQSVSESVRVTAGATLVDKASAAITSGLSAADFQKVPIGQEYRDLVRLIPGVQFTQDQTRGPSAGASGQDNVYNFDGVNVTLPLFGTLSAEPAVHDIAQLSIVKGGAKAVDFNRFWGFTIDSVSRSGTSQLAGQVGFQFQTPGLAAPLNNGNASRYAETRTWSDLSAGGPLVKDRAYFYGSYYRPELSRDNRANLYGPLPKFTSNRNEEFGKVTLTPATGVLLNGSFRNSHRLDSSSLFGSASTATTGTGNEAWLRLATGDGSWIINSKSFVSFKFTHFANLTQGRPDNIANVAVSNAIGTQLDVANLDKQGLFTVPSPVKGNTAFNNFIQPLINQYGYLSNGVPTGGGLVGFGSLFDKDDFFRTSGQFGYNLTVNTGTMRHDLHAGYQQYVDSENLTRSSNGWGSITAPGGRFSFQGSPIFYQAAFQQQGFGTVTPTIHSEYRSKNIEVNDTIGWQRFSFSVGVLASHDTLYGQGLTEDPTALSGYVLSTATSPEGRRYKMYDIPFSKMIQPRVSGTWAYDGINTVFASVAKYNPAASSLPRAASWDRSLATTINAYFDATGKLFAIDPLASSSGKLFVPNLTPRAIHEYLIGTSRQFSNRWSGRLYWRYRKGDHYWEDTNNNARVAFNPPPGIPQTLYIPDLAARLAQIGSGSSYVITELDGAFTKYKEVTAETEWHGNKLTLHMSYTWSHYYGNFDQDYSTAAALNDANIFIGSSNIGDGAGRQLWDNKLGTLAGDRPHSAKLFGSYLLPWNGSIGLYAVAQSGQPWQAESVDPYKSLTTSTSDTDRYAEPAGSRRTSPHAQLDLNYTQSIRLGGRRTAQIAFDVFNVFNEQAGYDIQPSVHSSFFGQPQAFFDPRRAQLAFRLLF